MVVVVVVVASSLDAAACSDMRGSRRRGCCEMGDETRISEPTVQGSCELPPSRSLAVRRKASRATTPPIECPITTKDRCMEMTEILRDRKG